MLERGLYSPSVRTIFSVAKVLKINPAVLMDRAYTDFDGKLKKDMLVEWPLTVGRIADLICLRLDDGRREDRWVSRSTTRSRSSFYDLVASRSCPKPSGHRLLRGAVNVAVFTIPLTLKLHRDSLGVGARENSMGCNRGAAGGDMGDGRESDRRWQPACALRRRSPSARSW